MSSFGELLKRERELRQISLREVSEATKINLRYLEALERNDFRHLPGGVFNKGFVRAYAQYIGVDPEAMINAYLLEERSQSGAPGVSPAGDVLRGRRGAAPPPQPDREALSRRRQRIAVVAVAAVVLLAVVAAVLWWWFVRDPSGARGSEPPPPAATTGAAADALPAPPRESGIPGGSGEEAGAAAEPPPGTDAAATEGTSTADAATDGGAKNPPGAMEPESAGPASHEVVVIVVRETSGRVVCDRRVEVLDRRAAGTEIRLECASVLVVEAADGGAVRVGIDGVPARAIGTDGRPAAARDLLGAAP